MLLGAGIRFGHGCRQLGFLFLIIVSGGSALALSPVLGVATDNNYPPGVIRGVDGQPEGFIVDLCRFWARKTGGRIKLMAMYPGPRRGVPSRMNAEIKRRTNDDALMAAF